MKSKKDLIKATPHFKSFISVLSKHKNIIDTGKLAEDYCAKLFKLKIVSPHNASIDAVDRYGKRVEIKQRIFKGNFMPGMSINLAKIDYVLYVELSDNLLPRRIFKINAKDIKYTKGKRVSFRGAFKENKVELVYNG